ncbi:hypothetical protein [Azospirillum sp.]|uniref:hypothetical protein n=1 Tax=Azospirillum sp. TaxID=34012 RepID=UPI003D726B0E
MQDHADRVARARDYNDGNSCASYAASTVEAWRDEAQAFVAWRDAVWPYVINTVMAAVAAGQRGMPREEDLLTELDDPPWLLPQPA